MLSHLSLVILCKGAVSTVSFNEFPTFIEKCKFGDSKCLARVITAIINEYYSGLPELDLHSFDPLHFDYLDFSGGNDSTLSLNLTIENGNLLGWKDFKVNKVIGFDEDPRVSQYELHLQLPLETVTGTYDMNGIILNLSAFGHGNCSFKFYDVDMRLIFKTEVFTQNGEDYLYVQRVIVDNSIKKSHADFGNALNDTARSVTFNAVINVNQALFFQAIGDLYGIATGKLIQQIVQPVFNRFPYRDLFAAP